MRGGIFGGPDRRESPRGRDRGASPTRIAVALGSNLGDRHRHLELGRAGITRFLEEVRCSSIYETEPHGIREQPRFLNACCSGRSRLAPETVLGRLQEIERAAGRRPGGARHGPRVLDLDLLLYGDHVIDRSELRVPHPRLVERPFVLIPLAEIEPGWVHPETGDTVGEIAEGVSAEGVERYGGWSGMASGGMGG